MMITTRFAAILFDFDGVLIDSEYAGNRHLADYLTAIGHPITPEQAMAQFMGLSGRAFTDAIEHVIGHRLPAGFADARAAEDARVMRDGIDAVVGAVAFVRALPPTLPRAIVSSSSTAWLRRHLEHIALTDAFGAHLYSGKEHVAHGKPAPDLYLYAAGQLGVAIKDCLVIEDSPVGVTGALASGAHVIGLCAGTHCAGDHASILRGLGVGTIAHDFATLAAMIA